METIGDTQQNSMAIAFLNIRSVNKHLAEIRTCDERLRKNTLSD